MSKHKDLIDHLQELMDHFNEDTGECPFRLEVSPEFYHKLRKTLYGEDFYPVELQIFGINVKIHYDLKPFKAVAISKNYRQEMRASYAGLSRQPITWTNGLPISTLPKQT